MSPTNTPFWIETEYDAEHASDGVSRYGAYVRQRVDSFAECWDGTFEENLPVRFAAEAWRVATPPIMVPGYVRYHPRILAAGVEYSYWDGSLAANVELITPWPRALAESTRWMEPTGRGWWRDWPEEHFTRTDYRSPTDQEISERPYLMARASLCFTIPDGQLPHPPTAQTPRYDLEDLARQSVAVVAAELNRVVGPIIQTLERNTARSHE